MDFGGKFGFGLFGRNSGIGGWWYLLWPVKLVIMMIMAGKTTSGFAGVVMLSGAVLQIKEKHLMHLRGLYEEG